MLLVSLSSAVDYQVTKKSFKFARAHHLPFYFVSASDGTNVVKVCCNNVPVLSYH